MPEIQPYDGNYARPLYEPGPRPDAVAPPPAVPGAGSAGTSDTQVDTASLTYFAVAVDQLNTMVNAAYNRLVSVAPVKPGAFRQAYDIRTKVSGEHGLVAGHLTVLNDLNNGFLELRDGMRELATRYQSVEDVNSITAERLDNAVRDADPQFSRANDDSRVV